MIELEFIKGFIMGVWASVIVVCAIYIGSRFLNIWINDKIRNEVRKRIKK